MLRLHGKWNPENKPQPKENGFENSYEAVKKETVDDSKTAYKRKMFAYQNSVF